MLAGDGHADAAIGAEQERGGEPLGVSRRTPERCRPSARRIARGAAAPRVFKNCKAVDKVYPHGIAKNFKVIKKADGLTGHPFVSAKLYAANHSKDRDHDGVACET